MGAVEAEAAVRAASPRVRSLGVSGRVFGGDQQRRVEAEGRLRLSGAGGTAVAATPQGM
jgi:hypothetical protein